MPIFEHVKEKVKNLVLVYLMIFVPMWLMYALQPILFPIFKELLGVSPRNFQLGEIVSISISWLSHGNLEHIVGNSTVLFGLLWIVALLEKNPFKIIGILILLSGFATWLLGSPNSFHIGASGLVFALMGYILSVATFGKKFEYLIPIVLFGSGYSYSLYNGLIPQQNVSFAAHFGGFMAAIIWVIIKTKHENKMNYNSINPKKSFLEKIKSKINN